VQNAAAAAVSGAGGAYDPVGPGEHRPLAVRPSANGFAQIFWQASTPQSLRRRRHGWRGRAAKNGGDRPPGVPRIGVPGVPRIGGSTRLLSGTFAGDAFERQKFVGFFRLFRAWTRCLALCRDFEDEILGLRGDDNPVQRRCAEPGRRPLF